MSSFFSTTFSGSGLIGPTGATGSTGPVGPRGTTGNGQIGNTGSALDPTTPYSWAPSTKNLTQTTTNASSVIHITGPTGIYQARVHSYCTGCTNSIVFSSVQSSGITYRSVNDPTIIRTHGDIITLKNISTTTPETIGITYDVPANEIVVTYTPSIPGLSFSDDSLNLMVKLGTGGTYTNFFGCTGSLYTDSTRTVDMKIRAYQERVMNVFPVKDESIISDIVLRWSLPIEGPTFANIFQLMPCDPTVAPGCTANRRAVDIVQNVETPLYAKGITVLIPSGITAGGLDVTLNILQTSFTYNNNIDGRMVAFPFSRDICFTDGLDVINLISIRSVWYGSYAYGLTASTNVAYDPLTMNIINPSTSSELDALCSNCSAGPIVYSGHNCKGPTYSTFAAEWCAQ